VRDGAGRDEKDVSDNDMIYSVARPREGSKLPGGMEILSVLACNSNASADI
jgi:hypothetical protein